MRIPIVWQSLEQNDMEQTLSLELVNCHWTNMINYTVHKMYWEIFKNKERPSQMGIKWKLTKRDSSELNYSSILDRGVDTL